MEQSMIKEHKKNTTGKTLFTMIIGVLPEIIFAWIVSKFIEIAVWKIWIWIQVIVLVSGAVKSLLEYVVFRFIWKNNIVENITESLSSGSYPNPKKYSFNTLAKDYFDSVMSDDDIPIGTRLDAAILFGTITSEDGKGLLRALRLDSAMREAIDRYHKIKFGGEDYN
jgi:hypothetical protein